MIIVLKLLVAHLLGDFVLQSRRMAADIELRKLRSPWFYGHLAVHGGLAALLLLGEGAGLLPAALIVVHGAVELLKAYFQRPANRTGWFLTAQGLHLLSIVFLWRLWYPSTTNYMDYLNSPALWTGLVAVLLLTRVSGKLLALLLSRWTKELSDEQSASLQDAGKWIGVLERLFVFTFIIAQQWQAIGFLIAAKSIFRFGDLKESKERKLTEYILIGTLLSFAVATAISLLTLMVLRAAGESSLFNFGPLLLPEPGHSVVLEPR